MALAWSYDDFYDLMEGFEDQPDREPVMPVVSLKVVPFFNTDPSEPAPFADEVYSNLIVREQLSIMSAFRKDLFVSVTLPILIAAIASVSVGWAAYAHIDSKLDAARADSSSSVDHLGDTLRIELRADRDARAKEFEALRLEMREDRKDTRDAIKELINRS
ncbi:hypothetical protein [Pseudomonas alliivorans]|uniref:hypothetical protein n=1 Tax=Pseudomonas fragariae (ex Marin et al. 2024) TaxID=3080056 RepID=UPI002EAED912|nr:hypothetical protein [Pseudomonas alliivorans]